MRICRYNIKYLLVLPLFLLVGLLFSTNNAKAFDATDIKTYYQLSNTDEYYGGTSLGNYYSHVTFVAGKFENAAYFNNSTGGSDGTNRLNANTCDKIGMSVNDFFSISMWYKKDLTPYIEGHLVTFNYTGGTNFSIHQHGTLENTGHLSLDADATGARQWTSTDVIFNDTNWHNYIVTGQWGRPSTWTVYKDNTALSGSWTLSTDYTPGTCGSDYALELGARGTDYGVNGYEDDFALFSKLLTSDERALLQTHSVIDAITPIVPINTVLFTNTKFCYAGLPCLVDFAYDNTTFVGPDDTLTIKTCSSLPYGVEGPLTCSSPTSTVAVSMPSYRLLNEFTPDSHVIIPLSNATSSRTLYVATMTKDGSSNLYSPYYFTLLWSPGGQAAIDAFNLSRGYSTSSPTTISPVFNKSPHDMACSADEWADSSWWQQLICYTKQAFFSVTDSFDKMAEDAFTSTSNSLKNIFPFSTINSIQQKWNSSTEPFTSFLRPKIALASDFSTSTGIIASSSAFSFSIPNFLGGGSTTTVNIFNKATIVGFIGQDVFDIYYTICRFFIWVLFFIFIWELLTKRTDNEIL